MISGPFNRGVVAGAGQVSLKPADLIGISHTQSFLFVLNKKNKPSTNRAWKRLVDVRG